jgi:hypothetical protein
MAWWRQTAVWTWCLVLLGLGLRGYHYGRNPSLWHDEAVVCINVLDKSFTALLGPLAFDNPSPPLFLWLEKLAELALGDRACAWRLLPFLASCAALVLMVPVCRRLLSPAAVPWAILLFACSDRVLWHSCEAKPYAVDLLCATALLAVFSFIRAWPLRRQLACYAALAPVLIFLAYPGCLLYGGLLACLLPAVARDRRPGTVLGYGLLAAATVGSFAVLLLGPIRAQRSTELIHYWLRQLPSWDRPWTVPWWTVASTFEMLRYCCKPTGGFLAVAVAVGGVTLWRSGQRRLVGFLLVPVLLALLAAYLRHYPYGHARTMLYAVPAVVILTAAGVPPLLAWLGRCGRPAVAGLVILLLAPAGLTGYRVTVHWERPDSAGATAYVLAHRRPNEAVAGSHWEHEYYFRRLAGRFTYIEGCPSTVQRVWVIAEGESAVVRRQRLDALPGHGWRVLRECDDFERTTIWLVARPYSG